MSQAVGTIDPGFDADGFSHSGNPYMSVNGPWLNNQHTHRRNAPWHTFGKASDTHAPGPSMLWVLVDEDVKGYDGESGLNDAAFAFGMEIQIWHDLPGAYHNGGCGFAFADGHTEIHKWRVKPEPGDANEADWGWMQQRTSAN